MRGTVAGGVGIDADDGSPPRASSRARIDAPPEERASISRRDVGRTVDRAGAPALARERVLRAAAATRPWHSPAPSAAGHGQPAPLLPPLSATPPAVPTVADRPVAEAALDASARLAISGTDGDTVLGCL